MPHRASSNNLAVDRSSLLSPRLWLSVGVGFIILAAWLAQVAVSKAIAAPLQQTTDPNLSISNEVCLGCHGQPGQSLKLENGDTLDLYVAPDDYNHSIHGSLKYACVQCHREVGNYPHPKWSAADRRDVSLKLYNACKYCHAMQYDLNINSVHAAALAKGKREAATCVDCHTAHSVRPLIDPKTQLNLPGTRAWIPQTCAQCHNAIYQEYKDSVHGSALIGDGNPDVPTCIDCHGVHNIGDPTTASYRLKSPEICARCHTDEKVMAKYGISTQVLSTYVADFHGTTVALFEKEQPDAQTNKPVCFDCHGIHNIARVNDPQKGLEVKQNLLARCQRCHPDAQANFPTAWLSHYIPSPDKYPLVYYVNLFYKFFIPGVLGGMALLVVMDLSSKTIRRFALRETKSVKQTPVAAGEGIEAVIETNLTEPPKTPSEALQEPPPVAVEPPSTNQIPLPVDEETMSDRENPPDNSTNETLESSGEASHE